VSGGKDLPEEGNSDANGCGNDDDRGNNERAINSPDTAATTTVNDNDDDEGMPRKTLVAAMIQRKTDAANADTSERGASNGQRTKLRQYLSLTFEAFAPPRSGCS
jgi:hypothetical protein